MTSIRILVCIVAVLFLGACGSQIQLLLPNQTVRRTPADLGYEYQEILLPSGADGHVAIWHVRTPGPRKGIIVNVPGAADNKSRYVIALPLYVDSGWDMILMDYEGFGDSSGTASLEGTVRSTRVVFDYALAQDPVVVGLGLSFGTAVLARVAADYDLKACIFDGTLNLWESVSLYAAKNYGLTAFTDVADLLLRLISPEDFDTKHWIAQVAAPKLFIHSPDDHLNPFIGAWEIYQEAPQPKFFFVVQGEHIADLFENPELYRSVVNGWLDGVVGTGPQFDAQYHALLDQELQLYLNDLRAAVPLFP